MFSCPTGNHGRVNFELTPDEMLQISNDLLLASAARALSRASMKFLEAMKTPGTDFSSIRPAGKPIKGLPTPSDLNRCDPDFPPELTFDV